MRSKRNSPYIITVAPPSQPWFALYKGLISLKNADEILQPDMLMFLDEAAWNQKTSGRTWGWTLVGGRCVQRRFFVHGQRYSILPVLTMDGIITYNVIPGPVTSARFVEFLRELVILLTNPYPGPWSVLVLENCSIHHSEEVRALVEDKAQCKLIFLPPY